MGKFKIEKKVDFEIVFYTATNRVKGMQFFPVPLLFGTGQNSSLEGIENVCVYFYIIVFRKCTCRLYHVCAYMTFFMKKYSLNKSLPYCDV